MFVITGRAQRVGSRAWAPAEAESLGLVGWVRNAADGSVEGEAEGPRPAVEQFLARCREGPMFAQVRSGRDAAGQKQGFEVRR